MIPAFLQEHFGNPDGVVNLLAKHGAPVPQRPAVVKWFARGSVPGEWVLWLMIALYREDGRWPNLTALIVEDLFE